jgi:hypothetical protein
MLGGINLMKTFFKVTVLGLLMVIFTAGLHTTAMAQDEKTEIYNKFMEHYKKDSIEDKEIAIAAAKEYNEKFNTPADKQLNDYFTSAIPDLEKQIAAIKEAERLAKIKAEKDRLAKERNVRLGRLNTAYNAITKTPNDAAKWDEYFAAGADVLKYEPEFVDVSIVLASGGSEIPKELQSNSKYDAWTVEYATKVIDQLDSGVKSNGDKFGEFRWVYGSKDNALTWMNLIIGQIKAKSDKDAAIPYYYKATKFDTGSKNWNLYRLIGSWYFNKLSKKIDEIKLIDKEVEENIPVIKKNLEVARGFAERSMDAYARSYKLAQNDPKVDAKQKEALFASLQTLFKFRYSQPDEVAFNTDENIKNYVSSIENKTMPNPASEVDPVLIREDKPEEKTDDAKTEGNKTSDMKTGTTRSRTVSKSTTDN